VDQEVGGSSPPSCTNYVIYFSSFRHESRTSAKVLAGADPMRTPRAEIFHWQQFEGPLGRPLRSLAHSNCPSSISGFVRDSCICELGLRRLRMQVRQRCNATPLPEFVRCSASMCWRVHAGRSTGWRTAARGTATGDIHLSAGTSVRCVWKLRAAASLSLISRGAAASINPDIQTREWTRERAQVKKSVTARQNRAPFGM
jgi:hypothetical protein